MEDRCLPSFLAPVSYPTGAGPQAVLTADFNGDGRLDLAVANSSSSTVSILLGNSDGTFQPAQNFATGAGPQSLAVGDFNGDGKLDLATGNAGDVSVSVLLGNGDGSFGAASKIDFASLGSSLGSVAVGDFNADGKLDLVVTTNVYVSDGCGYYGCYSHTEGCANVLLGNGDGSFAAPITSRAGYGSVIFAVVADFNGDGKQDLATTHINMGTVSVLLGDGLGNFLAPTDFRSGNYPGSVAAGDVNGDGHIDLVTANAGDNNVSVLLGDGAGGFGAAQSYAAGGILSVPVSVVLADFNHDTHLDIITSNQNLTGGSDNSVSVLLGRGNGTFSPPLNSVAGTQPGAVTAGDFNGDGWLDAATANATGNNVSVLINDQSWPGIPTLQVSSLVVSGFPSSTTAGTAGTFMVTAENAGGTTASGYTGTVHFTSSDGLAVLPAVYTFTAADGGVHTFSATLETAGTQSLTVTDTLTLSLTGSETGITVNPAAASHLGVSAPASSTAGSAFSVTVTALDPYNNTAIGYTGIVHFASTDGQAALPGDYNFTAADADVHTFTNGVTLKTAGSQMVTATDTVSSAITGNFAVTVSPAAASTLTVAGFPSPAIAGVAGSCTVTLKDIYGNLASGYTGTVHFTSSDRKASLPANYTFTAADAGVHTFSATLKTTGTQSIAVADSTTASLTGTDRGITVNPGAASQFILSAPASVSAGVAFSLTLTVEDAYGNVVTGYTGTIHFKSTDKTATLPSDYTFTAADKGVHTFTGLVLRKTGKQKITLTDTLNSSLTGSVIENVV